MSLAPILFQVIYKDLKVTESLPSRSLLPRRDAHQKSRNAGIQKRGKVSVACGFVSLSISRCLPPDKLPQFPSRGK